MREDRAEKDQAMTNSETTDKAANVAEQGAHVVSKKGSSKNAAGERCYQIAN